MGLFSNLFGSSSNIDKRLEEAYVPMLQVTTGMPLSVAKSTFRGMLEMAKEASRKQGTLNLPQNFGDILLEKEPTDETIKSMLAKKRNDGVSVRIRVRS